MSNHIKNYGKKIEAAKVAQEEFCEENSIPMFAPHNGICHKCGADIYQKHNGYEGYSLQVARSTHITSCPHCNASFLD